MKKILSVIFAFILISSCFAFTAFAEDDFNIFEEKQPIITFSENFNKMYVDNESFSRFDASMLLTDFGYNVLIDEEYNSDYYLGSSAYVDLTDEQKETVKDIAIETNFDNNMYRVEVQYNDGSIITIYFLEDSYFEEYNKVVNGDAIEYEIDFLYPDGNIVATEKSRLFGEATTITQHDLASLYDYYDVTAQNSDGSIIVRAGQLLLIDDVFYYVDLFETDFENVIWYDYSTYSKFDEFPVYKITDETLLADLQSAQQRYYEDDYGYLYNDDATDAVSAVFLIFVFAVIPAVILVIFLIKAIRGKGIYQKIYGAVAALCVAELAVFTIIAVIISNLN